MLRWLVSVVFCVTVIVGSNAHASILSEKQIDTSPVRQSISFAACSEQAEHVFANAEVRCLGVTASKSGGKRCHIDVAPLVSTLALTANRGRESNTLLEVRSCSSVERAPPLGPPRFVQIS